MYISLMSTESLANLRLFSFPLHPKLKQKQKKKKTVSSTFSCLTFYSPHFLTYLTSHQLLPTSAFLQKTPLSPHQTHFSHGSKHQHSQTHFQVLPFDDREITRETFQLSVILKWYEVQTSLSFLLAADLIS